MPVLSATFPAYDHPNVHLALLASLTESGGQPPELVGVSGSNRGDFPLAEILEMASRHRHFGVGPVDYVRVPVSVDDELSCVRLGFVLGYVGDIPGRGTAARSRAAARRNGRPAGSARSRR